MNMMCEFSEFDRAMMERALALAARGRGHVAPNPMVGAVITAPDGRVIGQGWHRRYGDPHAEVNAVRSVSDADRALLPESTIYVTLEPCSHYGKTPPCAKLLTECRFRRVVVGAGDPNPKVNGRGIAMLREAGIEVDCGLLADESERLNAAFFTAHRYHRPYITLKIARSADGYMDRRRAPGQPAARFSNRATTLSTMRLRAENMAILTTAATVLADDPALTVRKWPGSQPVPVIIDRHHLLSRNEKIFSNPVQPMLIEGYESLEALFAGLYYSGITSVLVEAGPRFTGALLEAGLWDALRVETAPVTLGDDGTSPCPPLPHQAPETRENLGGNTIEWYRHR